VEEMMMMMMRGGDRQILTLFVDHKQLLVEWLIQFFRVGNEI
jgi:hypothetical protein